MESSEKIALIKAGISARHEDYKRVKELKNLPLFDIEIQTGYTRHFITTCRKIAGWTRREKKT